MREFERKRKFRKMLSSPLMLVPSAVLLFFLVRGTWDIYFKNSEAASELAGSQDRLAKLTERQTALKAATDRFSTESGIEGEIRDRLQMAKVGEQEIVIVKSESETPRAASSSPSFLQKIWNFFTIR